MDNERWSRVASWADQHPNVAEKAREAATGGRPLPNVLATEPERAIELAEAYISEARREGAPEEVLEAVNESLERMRSGVQRLDKELRYVKDVLAKMKGMRSGFELGPALEDAIEGAPDDRNREKLTAMLELVRERDPSVDAFLKRKADEQVAELRSICDWSCCGFMCVACGAAGGGLGGCVFCCGVACAIC